MKRAAPVLATAIPLLLSIACAALMIRDDLADPFDPSRQGRATYGHNTPGELERVLLMVAVELLIALAIVRPWAARRGWVGATAAVTGFGAWASYSVLLTMHAGGALVLHALWLFLLEVYLVAMWIAAVVAAVRRSSTP